jgi:hypothetical protein
LISLPQPLECWDYRHVPPCPFSFFWFYSFLNPCEVFSFFCKTIFCFIMLDYTYTFSYAIQTCLFKIVFVLLLWLIVRLTKIDLFAQNSNTLFFCLQTADMSLVLFLFL